MAQGLLFQERDEPQEFELPAVIAGPFRMPIGEIRQVLRSGLRAQVVERVAIQVSTRTSETVLELDNGERVIVTDRPRLARPEGVDGILRASDAGALKWTSHRLTDAFQADVDAQGWGSLAETVARTWNGQIRYQAEKVGADGRLAAGDEGLRPPQLGALHAVGAHWSVFQTPATVVMPTGTGKTETMLAALAAYVRKPMLVVVPSDVLRSQTARKFLTFGLLRQLGILTGQSANPVVGVITSRPRTEADLEIFERCNVVIGTMSSLSGGTATPLAAAIADRVDTLVVDEAHHIGANGWSEFREAFAQRKILQFTATPFRRDGKLVDGQVIYNYPLRQAQQDGYFKPISFESVYEIDEREADRAIAEAAIAKLREDLAHDLNHLLMARCANIDRAIAIHQIYSTIAPDLRPLLVHSEMGDTSGPLAELRSGSSRVVVCVNMLGEGFDLPELKIAALHDLHKSLAILLQFTGQFTRSAGDKSVTQRSLQTSQT